MLLPWLLTPIQAQVCQPQKRGGGRKTDSLELKAIKAQIKNDEKQKAAQRIKELKKR